jgi:hypothetical protein
MNKFIFIIFSLFVSVVFTFGQNSLEKDLNKSFRNYDLVELNDKEVLEKVKNRTANRSSGLRALLSICFNAERS